jgi:hypothetical protein
MLFAAAVVAADELQRRACGRYYATRLVVVDDDFHALRSRVDSGGKSHCSNPLSKKELALPFRWQKKDQLLERLDFTSRPDLCP